MKISNAAINDYANSMFRFENLNAGWINSCTAYIRYLFGDSVKGKTVIDYAFGRGNWSIAFLNAGAKKVIAIDASQDNVMRFSSYCKSNKINNISIIHGNILENNLDVKGDVLWLYGILHHIEKLENPEGFMVKIKSLLNEDAIIYTYFYNKNSIRCTIVELCRKLHVYRDEKEFLEDHYLFLRCSKNRASDDLVAPYIKWWTASEAKIMLEKNGLFVNHQDIDFFEFCNKCENLEFYPHQFICSLSKTQEVAVKERQNKFQEELKIISLLVEEIIQFFDSRDIRKKISIGMFNSYFSQIDNGSDIKKAVMEVYLYLMRILIYNMDILRTNNKLVSYYLNLTIDALKDRPGRTNLYKDIGSNFISDNLINNRIRL